MRHVRALSLSLALLASIGAPLLWADDPPSGEGAAPAKTIAWHDGFQAGAAVAKEQGRLVFVYVGRHSPPCPPCRALDRDVFQKAESAAISDRFVAVRMFGGDEETPATRAFMQRYRIQGFPTLLAMTHGGAVLLRDLPRTTDGILGAMDEAQKIENEFQVESKALVGKTDLESRKRLVELYMQRFQLEDAVALQRAVAEQDGSVEAWGRLAGLYSMLDDDAQHAGVLRTMLARFPDHAERMEWRISLATMDLPTSAETPEAAKTLIGQHLEALRRVLGELGEGRTTADEAAVRFRLANLMLRRGEITGDDADMKNVRTELDWILANDPKGEYAAESAWSLAVISFQSGDRDGAIARLEQLVRDHPDHERAEHAKMALEQIHAAAGAEGGEGEATDEGE